MARLTSALIEAANSTGGEGNFLIMELGPGGPKPVYDGDGQLLKFQDGGEASRYSGTLARKTGLKYQPRRINDDAWKEREANRFMAGEYQHLPWHREAWWVALSRIHGDHYPHVSTKNSVGLMAYTENSEKGAADVQTAIKPGRYLETYLGKEIPSLLIRELTQRFSAKFEDNVVMYGETEDEFQEVFTKGPASCMSHPPANYVSHIHPVRVYAAGDLKVAYLKRDGRIVARCIVYPDKKLYNTVYGDHGRLIPLLSAMGYKSGVPFGARLKRVVTFQDKKAMKGAKAFVIPHVDGCSLYTDEGDFLRITNSKEGKNKKIHRAGGGGTGVTEWMGFQCDNCGADDLPANMIVKVVAHDTDNSKQSCWCPTCVGKDAFTCASSGYQAMKKHGVEMWDGSMWWKGTFKAKGFVCAGTGKKYPTSERVEVHGGGSYSKEYVRQRGGKTCILCGVGLLKSSECDTACKRAAMMRR